MGGAHAQTVVVEGARRAAEWDHPGFLAVLDWGRIEDTVYVVTAPQGMNLRAMIGEQGPVDELTALGFAAELADAVAYLHERALVYQVVDPGAVFVGRDARSAQLGWPWFVVPDKTPAFDDKGASRRAAVPPFVAPEAFDPKTSIERSVDVYGIGEILFFLLSGRSVGRGETMLELARSKSTPAPMLHEIVPTVTRPTSELAAELLATDANARPDAANARDRLRRIARRLSAGS
jgi:serine/threonine-protein kinase